MRLAKLLQGANNIMAEQTLELKIGTHVMCIANIDLDSVNQKPKIIRKNKSRRNKKKKKV